MASPVLQFKRGAFANLPGLRAGEPALTTDTYDLYVGIDSTTNNNKFFGSHRYWQKEDGSTSLRLKLVDKNGTNSINLKSPDTLAGVTTYTLPETITAGYFLRTNSLGVLEWSNEFPSIGVTAITAGIATFTDVTDNVLGNADTGAVQIDGGLGVNKNVTIGGNLNVQGYSEFVGVVTFKGGTINIGDSNTDNINVLGEIISNLVPNTSNTYDLGISTQKWRHAYFSGIGSFDTGAYIDSVLIGVNAANKIDTISGDLLLDSASGRTVIDDNLSVTGVATITGAFNADGNVILGNSSGDIITVNGTTTFAESITGTISTATRAVTVDTVQTSTNATHYLTFVTDNNGSAVAETVYTDAGISYNPSTNNLTISGDLAVNGGDITTDQTTFNLVNSTATSVNIAGAATNLVLGAATGIATISNQTIDFHNATTVSVDGANPTLTSASTGTLTLFNTNISAVNAFGDANSVSLGSTTGTVTTKNNLTVDGDIRVNGTNILGADGAINVTLTSNTLTSFAGDIEVGGNDIKASDGNINITLTSNTLTSFAGDIKVGGNDIQASDGNTNITMSSNTLTEIKGDLQVSGNDIKSSTGNNVITLNDTSATFANDVTVNGNLYVAGSTTQVNTSSITVEDRTIELGMVDGSAPSSSTTWDLGILFNYFSASAKKSAVVWEHGDSRFKFGSEVSDGGGTGNSNPQVTVTTFAPIEIGALWVNDCAGQSQVISCTGTTRYLENITIDGGTF